LVGDEARIVKRLRLRSLKISKMKGKITSFRDLEVYQNTYKACIEMMTKIIPELPDFEKNDLKSQLRRSVKAIPRLIGSAPEGEDVLCLYPEEPCQQYVLFWLH